MAIRKEEGVLADEIGDHAYEEFSKIYESYDIRDYKWIWTWQEAKEDWEGNEHSYLRRCYPTLQSYYRYWLKCAKSK